MTNQPGYGKDPHRDQPVRLAGEALIDAQVAVILAHGRGAQAEDILTLVPLLITPGAAFLAPQASGNAWYPNRFMEPIQSNEPWLSSALAFIDRTLAQILEAGIPAERTLLLGFSQGACLILEYAARNARRYGGLAGLSGGLIGPEGTPRNYRGSLDGTPVFLGCSDVDFHIPKERVDETAVVMRRLGGQVTKRLYPNMDHMVNDDEVAFVKGMLRGLNI
jgi:predicted esterase